MYDGGEKLAEGRVEYKVMSLVFLRVMPLVNAFHGDMEACCLEYGATAAFSHVYVCIYMYV